MATIERRIIIERPVEEVFAAVSDLAGHARWQTGLVELRQTSPEALGIGATVVEVRQFLGRRTENRLEVTTFEPNRRLAMRSAGGPLASEGAHAVAVAPGGTELTVSLQLQASGFFKLADAIIGRSLRRALDADLGNLKDQLEAGTPAAL